VEGDWRVARPCAALAFERTARTVEGTVGGEANSGITERFGLRHDGGQTCEVLVDPGGQMRFEDRCLVLHQHIEAEIHPAGFGHQARVERTVRCEVGGRLQTVPGLVFRPPACGRFPVGEENAFADPYDLIDLANQWVVECGSVRTVQGDAEGFVDSKDLFIWIDVFERTADEAKALLLAGLVGLLAAEPHVLVVLVRPGVGEDVLDLRQLRRVAVIHTVPADMLHGAVERRPESQRDTAGGWRCIGLAFEVVLQRADVEELVDGRERPVRPFPVGLQGGRHMALQLWFGKGRPSWTPRIDRDVQLSKGRAVRRSCTRAVRLSCTGELYESSTPELYG